MALHWLAPVCGVDNQIIFAVAQFLPQNMLCCSTSCVEEMQCFLQFLQLPCRLEPEYGNMNISLVYRAIHSHQRAQCFSVSSTRCVSLNCLHHTLNLLQFQHTKLTRVAQRGLLSMHQPERPQGKTQEIVL